MGRQLYGWVAGAMFALGGAGTAGAQAVPGSGFGMALDEGGPSPWRFQVSGLVSHFKDPECENCTYRTTVPGIGLRRDLNPLSAPIGYGLSAGLQTDSFGGSGGYAAATASIDLRVASLVFKPGIGAFAFYRYMEHGPGSETAKREIVPALLPMLSVEDARSGIGATVLVAPNFTYGGRDRSGFVFLQMTFRIGRDGTPPRATTAEPSTVAVASPSPY